jgi:hypothetical protein
MGHAQLCIGALLLRDEGVRRADHNDKENRGGNAEMKNAVEPLLNVKQSRPSA